MTEPTTLLALVTGASSGIGRELAKQFAEHDFDLVLCAEDAGLEGVAVELRAAGADVRTVQADLSTYDGVEQLCAAVSTDDRPLGVAALALALVVGVPAVALRGNSTGGRGAIAGDAPVPASASAPRPSASPARVPASGCPIPFPACPRPSSVRWPASAAGRTAATSGR